MTIELTAVEALRLSYLISVGKENTKQDDIKEVANNVTEQIEKYVQSLI